MSDEAMRADAMRTLLSNNVQEWEDVKAEALSRYLSEETQPALDMKLITCAADGSFTLARRGEYKLKSHFANQRWFRKTVKRRMDIWPGSYVRGTRFLFRFVRAGMRSGIKEVGLSLYNNPFLTFARYRQVLRENLQAVQDCWWLSLEDRHGLTWDQIEDNLLTFKAIDDSQVLMTFLLRQQTAPGFVGYEYETETLAEVLGCNALPLEEASDRVERALGALTRLVFFIDSDAYQFLSISGTQWPSGAPAKVRYKLTIASDSAIKVLNYLSGYRPAECNLLDAESFGGMPA